VTSAGKSEPEIKRLG